MSNEEFEDEDLETDDFEEDQALSNNLDESNMKKLIDSLNMLITDVNRKEYNYLVYENLIELNDNLTKIKSGYYSGFQSLLAKTLSLLEKVKEQVNDNLKSLIEEAIQNINKLFQKYGYDYNPKSDKYPKYPEYPKDKSPLSIGKNIAEHLHRKSTDPHYDSRNLTQDQLNSMIEGIAAETEGDTYPEATSLFDSALKKLKNDKEEYKNKIKLSKELKNEKLELANTKEEYNVFLKKMLGKGIDQLIVEFGD
jgi:hypothetical protein